MTFSDTPAHTSSRGHGAAAGTCVSGTGQILPNFACSFKPKFRGSFILQAGYRASKIYRVNPKHTSCSSAGEKKRPIPQFFRHKKRKKTDNLTQPQSRAAELHCCRTLIMRRTKPETPKRSRVFVCVKRVIRDHRKVHHRGLYIDIQLTRLVNSPRFLVLFCSLALAKGSDRSIFRRTPRANLVDRKHGCPRPSPAWPGSSF